MRYWAGTQTSDFAYYIVGLGVYLSFSLEVVNFIYLDTHSFRSNVSVVSFHRSRLGDSAVNGGRWTCCTFRCYSGST